MRDCTSSVNRIMFNGTIFYDRLAIAKNFQDYFRSVFFTSTLPVLITIHAYA